MNYSAQQWLRIALANAFGQDKDSFTDRVEWGRRAAQVFTPSDCTKADEPAYALAILDGLSGNNRVRVHLDATASGLQVLAAFANCRQSGTLTNLFGDQRHDAYTVAYQAFGNEQGIPRAEFKYAMVAASFGSRKVPRETVGAENMERFTQAFMTTFPGPWNVLRYLENLWQSDVHSHRWTMPDGFEVIQWNTGIEEETVSLFGKDVTVQKQVHTTEQRGIALMANVVHATDGFICREMVKRAQFDSDVASILLHEGFPQTVHQDLDGLLYLYRKSQFLSVDLINVMNHQTFRLLSEAERLEIAMLLEHLAAKKKAFYLLPVHDSFSCEAQYCNDMCDMYRYLMQQLWDSTLLDSIAEDITGKREHHTKHPAILDGVHMIC